MTAEHRLLIANRGEIALRIADSARLAGWRCVGVHARGEEPGSRLRAAIPEDEMHALSTSGPAAYLQIKELLDLAVARNCTAVHPGYGFLSESAEFAEACLARDLLWIGPAPSTLRLLGDKARARALATDRGVPVLGGSPAFAGLAAAEQWCRDWFAQRSPGRSSGAALLLKAVAGGGGRGQRFVRSLAELPEAFARAQSEAGGLSSAELYFEEHAPAARHIEVQIVADAAGTVLALGERDCTLQRRHQKLIEVAPAPVLDPALRDRLHADAIRLAQAADYQGVGTVEFLVFREDPAGSAFRHAFLEANPRLQVEHAITEAIYGVDLVHAQLRLATGADCAALPGLAGGPQARPGFAIELRLNAEELDADGIAHPAAGAFKRCEFPGGPGLRVDTAAGPGYAPDPDFDSLFARLIVHSAADDWPMSLAAARAALAACRFDGCVHNQALLLQVLDTPDIADWRVYTRYIDEHLPELLSALPGRRIGDSGADGLGADADVPGGEAQSEALLRAPLRGRVLAVRPGLAAGQRVRAGEELCVLEAMKMEHAVLAPADGRIERLHVAEGDTVERGQPLLEFAADDSDSAPGNTGACTQDSSAVGALEGNAARDVREDLAAVQERHTALYDDARPRARAKRHRRGQRTARENIADLVDADSFQEYGSLALAAQRGRRTLKELLQLSPADGLVCGTATVAGSRAAVMSYDYTVFAGTQGAMNHRKTDRLLGLCREQRLPLIAFTEGGGGRPGDTDMPAIAGLDLHTFRDFAALSGTAPRIAIASGRCFAGNAAFVGCSDIAIATADATIGMGGPVMIKGGGLGSFRAEEVGPAASQAANGVVDLLVPDESAAVRAARRALRFFTHGASDYANYSCADQLLLRDAVPAARLRAFDVRPIIETIADRDSTIELRRDFAPAMVTTLLRVGGQPMGCIANHSGHLAGAIDANAADKAARFLQLCDAFDLPVLSLIDTPGIMVGPEAERAALVRHAARLFTTAASMSVPVYAVVLRRGFGLGAMAMAAGGFHAPVFTVAWPTGEFGAMGLEGAVSTGFQKELAAVTDWDERQVLFDRLVREAHERGAALNMAAHLEIDDVIDPAASRDWILRGLAIRPPLTDGGWAAREKPKRMIDTW